MQYDAEFIETIVREVIRRLTRDFPGAVVSAASADATRERTLPVRERLVTLASLQGKLDGITQVELPKRCVITPAAMDELKQRRIAIRRGA